MSEVGLHVFGKGTMGMQVDRKKKLAAAKAHGVGKPIDGLVGSSQHISQGRGQKQTLYDRNKECISYPRSE